MTRWARDPRVLWRRSGSRVVLAPPGQEDTLLLEHTGALIWLLLDAPVEQEELVGILTESFDADAATIDAEVAAFLAELRGIEAVTAA